ELSTHLIAQGLTKLGHEVTVVTDGDHIEHRIIDGVSIRVVPMSLRQKPLFERAHSIASYRIFKRHIKDFRSFDIVHAHDFRSALMISHMESPKTIVTARDYAQICGCTNNIQYNGNIDPGCHGLHELWQCHRVYEASLARKPFRIWQYMYNKGYRKKAFVSFKHQIFISNAEKEVIEKYQTISHQHTAVVYNPIAQDYLSTPLASSVRGNILYTGRVEMYKGVRILLEAWKETAKTHSKAHLTIVGNGAQREEYERLTNIWGLGYRTTFLSHMPYQQLRLLIDNASIIVAPHLWVEPFGRNILEGMARGKIVIASNVGGAIELLENNKTGLLFERGSVPELEDALVRGLTMGHYEAKEMGLAAREIVRTKFTQEIIAKQHEEFYTRVL
ncbi:MAG TPA: glycosyltransferase family 4 protein, partial [Candidatus Andersenbacteria bacterium]|nr:glycosyltransferase family 4 protein [Candidatus Andersenbacteria bacterium]